MSEDKKKRDFEYTTEEFLNIELVTKKKRNKSKDQKNGQKIEPVKNKVVVNKIIDYLKD